MATAPRPSLSLERLLHTQGFGSRKTCRALVRQGRVTVAGRPCADPFAVFAPDGLEFGVDGVTWRWREQVYLAMHKPAGHECSHQPVHHPSVFALLPPPLVTRGGQPAGRLDADTTGLLLFSDDGRFIHALTSPRRGVAKVYRVTLRHPADEALIAALLAGVQLRDATEPVAAAACERIDAHRLRLTLTGGRYHQVKRMVAAAGNRVEALHREAVGGYVLPSDLAPGSWTWIESGDVLG